MVGIGAAEMTGMSCDLERGLISQGPRPDKSPNGENMRKRKREGEGKGWLDNVREVEGRRVRTF